jgi:hypothetical protein
MITALLGIALVSKPGALKPRAGVYLVVAGVAIITLFLTEIRSILMMTAVGVLLLAAVMTWQRGLGSLRVALLGLVLIAGAFSYAVAIGGKHVQDRFQVITDTGLAASYQENRGLFVAYTVEEALPTYPLGAGVGRWGTMNVYFADKDTTHASTPLWVEIQITGWLFDGGVLMWFFYGGAIIAAIFFATKLALSCTDPELAHLCGLVLCLEMVIFGMSWSGAAFNTQMGMFFWTLAGGLFGAIRGSRKVPFLNQIERPPSPSVIKLVDRID